MEVAPPCASILFNIHKLTALGAVVIAVIRVVQMLKNLNPLPVIASSWQQCVSWRCLPAGP